MKPDKKHGVVHWKIILGLLVVFFIGAQVITMVFAGKKVGRVVDPDYYAKGKDYGQDLLKTQAARPDWTVQVSLQADHLVVTVKERSGVPVTGGTGRLELPGVAPMELVETASGIYRSRDAITSTELRGSISIVKGNALFTDQVALFR